MITVTGGKKRPTIKLKQAERCPVQLWVIKHSEFALHIRWKRLNLLSLRLTAKYFYTIRNKLLAFLLYNGLICRVQYSTCLTSLCLYSGLLTHKNRVWYTIHTFSHAVWRHANPKKGCNLAVTEWVKMYAYRQTLNSRVSVPLNIFYTIWLNNKKARLINVAQEFFIKLMYSTRSEWKLFYKRTAIVSMSVQKIFIHLFRTVGWIYLVWSKEKCYCYHLNFHS